MKIKENIRFCAMAYLAAMCSVSLVSCSDDDEPEEVVQKKMHNGHEYVDLGLPSKTLWAACNVGAETPDAYGQSFAWGETEVKEAYGRETYKYCDGSENALTKYCSNRYKGIVDYKTELDKDDDVAVLTWGGNWETPTAAQIEELLNNCYWVWTTKYNGKGVTGYIVYQAKSEAEKGEQVHGDKTPSSDYNVKKDAHIFLPCAGFRSDIYLVDDGKEGYYWSRSLRDKDSREVHYLNFDVNSVYMERIYRFCGVSVRPVCFVTD